jgi:hypothetical protein
MVNLNAFLAGGIDNELNDIMLCIQQSKSAEIF